MSVAKTYKLKNRDVSGSEHAVSGVNWWSPKRLFDFSVAFLMLIPALPIIGVLVLMVRLSSKGPGIYRQVRVGLNGKTFTLFKLRSMRADAETASGAVWSTGNNDNRVTKLGKFLRYSHLDELPQLFNVLKGEMSLVGPRPERPEITPVLEDNIPRYAERNGVLPGITGYAQINLPPDTDLNSVRRKLLLDLQYIENRTLWFDIRIILCTLKSFLFIEGTWILKCFGVYQQVSDEAVQKLHFIETDRIDGDKMESSLASVNEKQTNGRSNGTPFADVKAEKSDLANSDLAKATANGHSSNGNKISNGKQISSDFKVTKIEKPAELDSSIVCREIGSESLPNQPR